MVFDWYAVDVRNASNLPEKIWLYQFNSSVAQHFKIEKSHQNGFYKLVPKCATNLIFTIGENQKDDQCSLLHGNACTRPQHKQCMNNQLVQFIKKDC